MNIKTFNTGRKYTEIGQRIAWSIISEVVVEGEVIGQTVSFADADRGIDGTVMVAGDEVRNGDVLRGYDHGGYGWDQDRERVQELYRAARNSK